MRKKLFVTNYTLLYSRHPYIGPHPARRHVLVNDPAHALAGLRGRADVLSDLPAAHRKRIGGRDHHVLLVVLRGYRIGSGHLR